MESRKENTVQTSSSLPADYFKLVQEVLNTNFDAGLKQLAQIKPNPKFEVSGSVFKNEIVLCVSLTHEGHLSATSVYASCDFDPKASAPTIQDLLGYCVDAIGSFYSTYLSTPEKIELLAQESLSALEDAPFQWTEVEIDKHKIFIKVNKSNPKLDKMTDEWLSKNDPEQLKQEKDTQKAAEGLFITGQKQRKPS